MMKLILFSVLLLVLPFMASADERFYKALLKCDPEAILALENEDINFNGLIKIPTGHEGYALEISDSLCAREFQLKKSLREEIIKALKDLNVNIHQTSLSFYIPEENSEQDINLYKAMRNCSVAEVKSALANGADPNSRISKKLSKEIHRSPGMTPISFMAGLVCPEFAALYDANVNKQFIERLKTIIGILLDAGADPYLPVSIGNSLYTFSVPSFWLHHHIDLWNMTPLMLRFYLERGIDVNVRSGRGKEFVVDAINENTNAMDLLKAIGPELAKPYGTQFFLTIGPNQSPKTFIEQIEFLEKFGLTYRPQSGTSHTMIQSMFSAANHWSMTVTNLKVVLPWFSQKYRESVTRELNMLNGAGRTITQELLKNFCPEVKENGALQTLDFSNFYALTSGDKNASQMAVLYDVFKNYLVSSPLDFEKEDESGNSLLDYAMNYCPNDMVIALVNKAKRENAPLKINGLIKNFKTAPYSSSRQSNSHFNNDYRNLKTFLQLGGSLTNDELAILSKAEFQSPKLSKYFDVKKVLGQEKDVAEIGLGNDGKISIPLAVKLNFARFQETSVIVDINSLSREKVYNTRNVTKILTYPKNSAQLNGLRPVPYSSISQIRIRKSGKSTKVKIVSSFGTKEETLPEDHDTFEFRTINPQGPYTLQSVPKKMNIVLDPGKNEFSKTTKIIENTLYHENYKLLNIELEPELLSSVKDNFVFEADKNAVEIKVSLKDNLLKGEGTGVLGPIYCLIHCSNSSTRWQTAISLFDDGEIGIFPYLNFLLDHIREESLREKTYVSMIRLLMVDKEQSAESIQLMNSQWRIGQPVSAEAIIMDSIVTGDDVGNLSSLYKNDAVFSETVNALAFLKIILSNNEKLEIFNQKRARLGCSLGNKEVEIRQHIKSDEILPSIATLKKDCP